MEILDPTGPPTRWNQEDVRLAETVLFNPMARADWLWPKLSWEFPPRLVRRTPFLLLKEIDHHRRVIHRVLSDQENGEFVFGIDDYRNRRQAARGIAQ